MIDGNRSNRCQARTHVKRPFMMGGLHRVSAVDVVPERTHHFRRGFVHLLRDDLARLLPATDSW